MKLRRILKAGRTILSDWRWTPFFVQRRIRRPRHREAAVRLLSRTRPGPAADSPAPAPDMVDSLRDEGQALLGSVLTPQQCGEIREYLSARKVYDEYRSETPAWLPLEDQRHPHSHVGYHDHADVVRAPHLLALANRSDILAIVGEMLGCRPTLSYLAAWWSYATGVAAQQAENFHRDLDDWRFIKLFVYLTDVDESKGPHMYVRKSGQAGKALAIRRYTDDEIRQIFPVGDIVTMTGEAGAGFLENTYGIHKGQPVKEGHRLIFQAVYSIMPLPYGPRAPVIGRDEARAVSGMDLDPFVNRIYVKGR